MLIYIHDNKDKAYYKYYNIIIVRRNRNSLRLAEEDRVRAYFAIPVRIVLFIPTVTRFRRDRRA